MPLIEIADFNRDGLFDLAYARTETQEIVVLYNQLSAVAANVDQLCNSQPRSVYEFFVSNPTESNQNAYLYSVADLTDG